MVWIEKIRKKHNIRIKSEMTNAYLGTYFNNSYLKPGANKNRKYRLWYATQY